MRVVGGCNRRDPPPSPPPSVACSRLEAFAGNDRNSRLALTGASDRHTGTSHKCDGLKPTTNCTASRTVFTGGTTMVVGDGGIR